MTVPIERSNVRIEAVVRGFSRYKQSEVIYWGEQRRMTFGTYLRQPYVSTGNEKVAIVTPGMQYRPDLLSYDYYGFPDAWWRILEANGMKDVYEFVPGVTVILPEL